MQVRFQMLRHKADSEYLSFAAPEKRRTPCVLLRSIMGHREAHIRKRLINEGKNIWMAQSMFLALKQEDSVLFEAP